jgi:SNF2 family DNA or RNA helicase
MNNTIEVTYDEKTRRLSMKSPFHLADAMRGFPSRRFDPKSKTWKVPLVKGNILHIDEIKHRYEFAFNPAAMNAIRESERLTSGPVYIPFPGHVYDFTESKIKYTPMKHQEKMLDLSWGLTASAWFAKMGTGKTYTAIHMMFAAWKAGEIDAVCIIAPSTLRRTWAKEFEKYATGGYDLKIHGTKAPWITEFYNATPRDHLQVLAVSVEGLGVSEGLYDSVCGFFSKGKRILTIVDESSRIKNPKAKRTERVITIGACSHRRLILNGTPIALGIEDLWSQYEFLDPNIIGMGDYWAFRTRYLEMGGYEDKQIIGYKHVDELMNMIIPYTVEVGKDVLNLPDKMMKEIFVELTPEQRRLIRVVVKGAIKDPTAPLIKVTNSLEKRLRCRQIVGGWLPQGELKYKEIDGVEVEWVETTLVPLKVNPKMDALFDMIEDNFRGSKFIIWTSFVHEIEYIRDRLAEKYGPKSVECYYGKTEMNARSDIEDRYCTDPKMRFFIGNPVAAGLGITLISGENDVMVYYSGTDAYIERAQSEDRAHRIGQKNTVTVVDIVGEKSVDSVILESIKYKMSVEEYIMTRIAAGVSMDDLLLGEKS